MPVALRLPSGRVHQLRQSPRVGVAQTGPHGAQKCNVIIVVVVAVAAAEGHVNRCRDDGVRSRSGVGGWWRAAQGGGDDVRGQATV